MINVNMRIKDTVTTAVLYEMCFVIYFKSIDSNSEMNITSLF